MSIFSFSFFLQKRLLILSTYDDYLLYTILRKKSITENTVLEYGIKLGMSKKDLIDILGLPDKIENEEYLYENYTTGYGDTVIINIVNDKISDISYSIEK